MTLGSHSGPSAQNYHKIVEENRNLTQRVAELEFFRDNLQKDWEHQRASIDATLHAMQTRFEVQLNVLLDLMNKVASTPCPMHSNTDSKSSKLSTIGERNVTEAVITTSTNSYTHSTVEHEKLSSTQLSVQTSRSETPSVPKPGATGADKKSPSQLSPMPSIASTPISNLASLSPLGLELADAMPSDPGVIVISVLPGSHADQAGLQPGDLVRSVNGVPVISRRAFREILEEETRHFATGMDLTVINAELDEKVIRLPLIYESHTTSTA